VVRCGRVCGAAAESEEVWGEHVGGCVSVRCSWRVVLSCYMSVVSCEVLVYVDDVTAFVASCSQQTFGVTMDTSWSVCDAKFMN
jgi:hypothetical protein